jgi:hypothetical protein
MIKSENLSKHSASFQSPTPTQEINYTNHSKKFSHQQHIKKPETQKKITEFTFNEPDLSYHEIAARPKYRPTKHGIHYLDEDNTLYYNAKIEDSDWVDETIAATRARDEATARNDTLAERTAAYNAELTRQQGINARVFAEPPRWVLIKRKALNDTRMEDSLLQYVDKKHTQVDWYSTITTIRETGHKIG